MDKPYVFRHDSFGMHHLPNRAFGRINRQPEPIVVADEFRFLLSHASRNNAN
nr:hypothetical protein [uncultured Paracoccus sp.]